MYAYPSLSSYSMPYEKNGWATEMVAYVKYIGEITENRLHSRSDISINVSQIPGHSVECSSPPLERPPCGSHDGGL